MGRPVFPHELIDPDFTWLVTNYRDNHPQSVSVESTCLPVVFITEDPDGADDAVVLLDTSDSDEATCSVKTRP